VVAPGAAPPPRDRSLLVTYERTIGARIASSFLVVSLLSPAAGAAPASLLATASVLSPKDVADDLLAVRLVDLVEIDAAVEQVVIVLGERVVERCRASGVLGVGLQATQERRQALLRRGASGGRVKPELLGELVDGQLGHDVVDGGHAFPSRTVCGAEPTPSARRTARARRGPRSARSGR
jgi:hypothetical protein